MHLDFRKHRQGYVIAALIVISGILILTRLSGAIYSSEITRFNPEDAHGAPILKGARLFIDPDNTAWLMNAKEAYRQKKWQVHEVSWDSTTGTRPMHWSSPLVWALLGGSELAVKFLKISRDEALETVQPIVYSLIYFGLLCIVAVLAVKGFGIKLGSIFFGLLASAEGLTWTYFHPFRIDHHGTMVVMLAIYYGALVKIFVGSSSRIPAIIAGVSAGIAIWISAITSIPALVIPLLMYGGCLIYQRIGKKEFLKRISPTTWILFGILASALSLVGYLIEYGFSPFIRLEVNSPLYAGAMLGGSILLAGLVCIQDVDWWPNKLQGLLGASALIAVIIPFAHLAYYQQESFTLLNPFWERLPHIIQEGMPVSIMEILQQGLLGVILAAIVVSHCIYYDRKLAHILPLLLTAVMMLLMLLFARRLYAIFVIVFYAYVLALLYSIDRNKLCSLWATTGRIIFLLCTMQLVISLGSLQNGILVEKRFGLGAQVAVSSRSRIISEDIVRDSRETQTPIRVLATPELATFISYYTGGRSTGGIYWESMDIFEDSLRALFSRDEKEAEELIDKMDVTYIVIPEAFPDGWGYVYGGLGEMTPDKQMFLERAKAGKIPWVSRVQGKGSDFVFRVSHKSSRGVVNVDSRNEPEKPTKEAGKSVAEPIILQ